VKAILRVIDSISEYCGRATSWCCLVLVLVLFYEVVARYVFSRPTIWASETSTMLGATIAALGWAYTHRHRGHVGVDVFSSHLSPKAKAISDVILTLLFFFPLIIIFAYIAGGRMYSSWALDEKLIETYWYPPAGPIRAVVFLGFCLFALQGFAQFIRDLQFLMGKGNV